MYECWGFLVDDTKFGQPLPWIGVYIAAASLACLITMAADLIHGIRGRNLWFPCKYFCLNATSLTVIAVALKLSVDLNNPMPRSVDQLAKLSSSALICTIMGNSMPSLGVTENKETLMNVVAMGILVITVIVNICIQLDTGVITPDFRPEHAVITFLMLIMLMTLFSSAVAIPKMKHDLELKYDIDEEVLKESSNQIEEETKANNQVINNLRHELMRVWMMAHTSSPQFVLVRSVTCTASAAFCLLSTLTLAVAMFRAQFDWWNTCSLKGDSDYKWSIYLILIVQVPAVVVGTIAPAVRWFMALSYRWPSLRHKSTKRRFHVEGYWTDSLVLMKERPLGFHIHNRQYRKLAHDAKVILFKFLIKLQIGIVLMSKATQFVSIFLMCFVLAGCGHYKRLKSKFDHNVSSTSSGAESKPVPKLDLSRFVLLLEGEEELHELMMKDNRDATTHLFQAGEKKEPKHIIELIEKCSTSQGFKGVAAFDSDQVPPLHAMEAPYGWSLPLVTLASIIVALPNIDRCSVKNLIGTLSEGLLYVKFIENNIDKEGKLVKVRRAAEFVWLGVDLYDKWLDVDLCKLSLQGKSPKETLETLAGDAKIRYDKFKAKYSRICDREAPSSWPIEVLASNSMYRISRTTLLNHEGIKDYTSERLFEALTGMISDILGACLTNLPYALSTKCSNSAIGERKDSVRDALRMLGQTKRIIEMLEERACPSLDFSRGTSIEDWRLMHKQNGSLPSVSRSLENDTQTAPPESDDLCLNID